MNNRTNRQQAHDPWRHAACEEVVEEYARANKVDLRAGDRAFLAELLGGAATAAAIEGFLRRVLGPATPTYTARVGALMTAALDAEVLVLRARLGVALGPTWSPALPTIRRAVAVLLERERERLAAAAAVLEDLAGATCGQLDQPGSRDVSNVLFRVVSWNNFEERRAGLGSGATDVQALAEVADDLQAACCPLDSVFTRDAVDLFRRVVEAAEGPGASADVSTRRRAPRRGRSVGAAFAVPASLFPCNGASLLPCDCPWACAAYDLHLAAALGFEIVADARVVGGAELDGGTLTYDPTLPRAGQRRSCVVAELIKAAQRGDVRRSPTVTVVGGGAGIGPSHMIHGRSEHAESE